jgi:hypothetical protein
MGALWWRTYGPHLPISCLEEIHISMGIMTTVQPYNELKFALMNFNGSETLQLNL